ncbi:hypothetical protein GL213_03935 [Halogeometricum borinquense]|uniref:Uncharacterized protein n=1 Tax=Halogeometricum borinquense TaxID=60847 RepID=A0A6C0UPE1_9EURY|nr:hypothetical protein [Halogeometricum borinquense]QIB75749.1 hypothetical protein G3I44_16565 [Halogeometricum borinquense]QIQ75747.1 hypothetical protein GL213_03935 [Halogeometricum borinquense]
MSESTSGGGPGPFERAERTLLAIVTGVTAGVVNNLYATVLVRELDRVIDLVLIGGILSAVVIVAGFLTAVNWLGWVSWDGPSRADYGLTYQSLRPQLREAGRLVGTVAISFGIMETTAFYASRVLGGEVRYTATVAGLYLLLGVVVYLLQTTK